MKTALKYCIGTTILVSIPWMFPGGPIHALMLCEYCNESTPCETVCIDEYGVTTCEEWGVCEEPIVYDMVQWMTQTYTNHGTTHLEQPIPNNGVISEFSSCNFTGGFYRVSSACGQNHERFTYNSGYIFLTREAFQDSSTHFKTHTNFVWLRRHMTSGESFWADCSWKEYTACNTFTTASCLNRVTLTGPVTLSLGGDVGTVEALVRSQTLGDNTVEKYFYAIPYGFVKYEHRSAGGSLIRSEVFNRIVSGNVKPHTSSCYSLDCSGQSGSCP